MFFCFLLIGQLNTLIYILITKTLITISQTLKIHKSFTEIIDLSADKDFNY